MASRYWVGGTDTWNGTAGTKWATTSGGTGGAAVPTSSDDVFIDNVNSIVTLGANATTRDLTISAGTFIAATYDISCWRFISIGTGTRTIHLGSGTLSHDFFSNGAAYVVHGSGLSFDAGTSTITFPGAMLSVQMVTDILTYYDLHIPGSANEIILTTPNTQGGIENPGDGDGRLPAYGHDDAFETYLATNSIVFNEIQIASNGVLIVQGGLPITVSSLVSLGTAATKAFLASSLTGSQFYLLTTKAFIDVGDYLNVGSCRASDNRFFIGANSTDVGNNDGLVFGPPPTPGYDSGFLTFMQ